MRVAILSGLLAGALAGSSVASEASGAAQLEASLDHFCELVNQGKASEAVAYFLPDATIIEDLAPYSWHGPTAGMEWLQAMNANAERSGMSGVNMHFLPATMVQITGERAYAVIPGDLTYSFKDGTVRHAQGHVTFSLRKVAADWRIGSLTWAWERAGQ
ncbi:MAG TPA: nuclear transport factor 2 family protein [Caulobacteraceae bacterium]